MNLVNVCPNIPDGWRGGVCDVSRVLGLHRETIKKYALIGKRYGGIDYRVTRSGRKTFTGREVKRFWEMMR